MGQCLPCRKCILTINAWVTTAIDGLLGLQWSVAAREVHGQCGLWAHPSRPARARGACRTAGAGAARCISDPACPCAWPAPRPVGGHSHRSGSPAHSCTLWVQPGREQGNVRLFYYIFIYIYFNRTNRGSGGSKGTFQVRRRRPSETWKHCTRSGSCWCVRAHPQPFPPVAGLVGALRYIPSHGWGLPGQGDHCWAGGTVCSTSCHQWAFF